MSQILYEDQIVVDKKCWYHHVLKFYDSEFENLTSLYKKSSWAVVLEGIAPTTTVRAH